MPSRLIISMRGRPADNPFRHARWVHRIVLGWAEKGFGNPEAAAKLHDDQGMKPLSIAPLLAVADGVVEMRVSSLDDELTDAIRAGIRKSETTIVHAAGNRQHEFTIIDDSIDRIDVSWNSLIKRAQPATAWTVETLTPTVCRGHLGTGRESVNFVTPLPERYIRSWLHRFKAFSPVQIPDEELLGFVTERVFVAALDGRTVEVPAGKSGQMIAGYVGSATFEVAKPKAKDREMLTVLDTVVSLAEFCGTGAHTMWGIGVTRTDRVKVL